MVARARSQGGADLHLHTTFSDGYCSPREVIERVARIGLEAVAITDHDEISAIDEAVDCGRSLGVEVLSGVELSVIFRGKDVHMLAYCFDPEDPALIKELSVFRDSRLGRARAIVDKLDKLGMPISFEAVIRKAGHGSVGRPHIANVLLEDGFVYSFHEAFDKYIGNDKPAHVEKYQLDLFDALDLIRAAGGVCVVAHPAIQLSEQDLRDLIAAGVHGIEVVHPKHTPEEMEHYRELARENGLIATGGSDFHGGPKGDECLGRFTVPYSTVGSLYSKAGGKDA